MDNLYEYIAAYVDDLAIAAKDPVQIRNAWVNDFKFKLKWTGPISYHLGMDFCRDDDGTLYFTQVWYIEKICDSFTRTFGHKPNQHNMTSPIDKKMTILSWKHQNSLMKKLIDEESIQKYQSLISALQWAVSIARFDYDDSVIIPSIT